MQHGRKDHTVTSAKHDMPRCKEFTGDNPMLAKLCGVAGSTLYGILAFTSHAMLQLTCVCTSNKSK